MKLNPMHIINKPIGKPHRRKGDHQPLIPCMVALPTLPYYMMKALFIHVRAVRRAKKGQGNVSPA